MIVSAILDPTAVSKEHLNEKSYRLQVEQFLRGILENGVLIFDDQGILRHKMLSIVKDALINPNNKGIAELLLFLFDNKVVTSKSGQVSSRCSKEVICQLEKGMEPEIIISGCQNREWFFRRCCGESEIVTFDDYSNSEFEEKRLQFRSSWPLHLIDVKKCDLFIIATVKFAKTVRIYDKQIGKSVNIHNFERGIHYILKFWKDYGFFSDTGKIEIFTGPFDKSLQHQSNAPKSQEEANSIIESKLIGKLKKKISGLSIKLFIQELDNRGQFHDRYLETDYVILCFTRGFDFLKPRSKHFKDCEIHHSPNIGDHLAHFRDCRTICTIGN